MTASDVLIEIGRFVIGAYFLVAGVRNVSNFALHTGILAAKKMPQPGLVLAAALVMQIGGGALVALNVWPVFGAAALIVFTACATVLYHDFWNYAGPERVQHTNAWMTNGAVIGALLLVIGLALQI